MRELIYRKVSETAKGKRIWIEDTVNNGRLAKAGFLPGECYNVIFDVDTLEIRLELSLFGNKRVSGRKRPGKDDRTPIIDLLSKDITDFVEGANPGHYRPKSISLGHTATLSGFFIVFWCYGSLFGDISAYGRNIAILLFLFFMLNSGCREHLLGASDKFVFYQPVLCWLKPADAPRCTGVNYYE